MHKQHSCKIAFITGASRGIGQAILQKLAADGYYVIGSATSDAGVQNINATIESIGAKGHGTVLQLEKQTDIETCITQIETQYGSIDILVNNAGITRDNLLLRMSEADWDNVLGVNLKAPVLLAKSVLRGMMKARFGRIINISSVVAQMANPGQSNYSAAKAGLEGFTRSLAGEMGSRGITVNCVAPGFIQTQMTHELSTENMQAFVAKIPMARLGTPMDVAHAVSFLASEHSSYITGAIIPVNGGLY